MAVFAAIFLVAVLIFADVIKVGKDKEASVQGKVLIWGTADSSAMRIVKEKIENENEELSMVYSKKSPDTYQEELRILKSIVSELA